MIVLKYSEIQISPQRQRRVMEPGALNDLMTSIDKNGLLHPIVVRREGKSYILVAGERRLRAIETLWALGGELKFDSKAFVAGSVPCTLLIDLDPLDAFECELEENIRRVDLTWQEASEAAAKLAELRLLQAERHHADRPSHGELAQEIYPDYHPNTASTQLREDIILSRALVADPEIAKAPDRRSALKLIARKEEAARSSLLSLKVGQTFSSRDHTLHRADALQWLSQQPGSQYDCILTDPPYGINAHEYGDSAGKAPGGSHHYDDSYETWYELLAVFAKESFRLAKPASHLYCFCDVDNFLSLRDMLHLAGWQTFRTPFIWHNPSSQRAPWPLSGPHRRYQMLLYAIKGGRPVLYLRSDVLEFRSDDNLGWAAQKPVALYQELLTRTCRAGDTVLDCFCGSGTIFPAAHDLKIRATGVEIDPVAHGIAAERIANLVDKVS